MPAITALGCERKVLLSGGDMSSGSHRLERREMPVIDDSALYRGLELELGVVR